MCLSEKMEGKREKIRKKATVKERMRAIVGFRLQEEVSLTCKVFYSHDRKVGK